MAKGQMRSNKEKKKPKQNKDEKKNPPPHMLIANSTAQSGPKGKK